MPSVIKGMGKSLSSVEVGWLSAVPFLLAAVGVGVRGDLCCDDAAQVAKPLFWSLPTAFLGGVGATSGLALINSLGNLAGFVSPFAVGWIQDASGGNVRLSMTVMILANVLAMAVIAGLRLASHPQSGVAVPEQTRHP